VPREQSWLAMVKVRHGFLQAGTFTRQENLLFSRALRTRHVIHDVRRLTMKIREGLPVPREPA